MNIKNNQQIALSLRPINFLSHILLLLQSMLFLVISTNILLAQNIISQETSSFIYKGDIYYVIDGAAVQIDKKSGKQRVLLQLFDPDYLTKNYKKIDGVLHIISPKTGKAYPILRNFSDGFENADTVRDFISATRGWTSMTLQGPRSPRIRDYVKLRHNIFNNKSDFLDNRVEPSTQRAYSGSQSLRTLSVKPKGNMQLTKASLDSGLLYFSKGDDFWFSGWFFIERGTPTSLIDLEADYINMGPGMRLMVSPSFVPRLELKWADKPTYRINKGNIKHLPTGEWFNIKLHFFLSDEKNGTAKLWLNDELLIDASGQTLPLQDTVLTRLELGITASPKGVESLLYVDDVIISDSGFD